MPACIHTIIVSKSTKITIISPVFIIYCVDSKTLKTKDRKGRLTSLSKKSAYGAKNYARCSDKTTDIVSKHCRMTVSAFKFLLKLNKNYP